jgi:hypothetical protein
MRQLLIEKYIYPSESKTSESSNTTTVFEYWYNKYGELHSILGQPSYVRYKNEKIRYQSWHINGLSHRESNLPSDIFYNNVEKKRIQHWCKNGEIIKQEYLDNN